MPFPLKNVPVFDYHAPPNGKGHKRWFGAAREAGRLHAGVDLIAALGTEIFACEDGYVLDVATTFPPYDMVGVVALQCISGRVVRYCEVLPESLKGIEKGRPFKAGELIAKVGKMNVDSMLHFELYSGAAKGALTQKLAANKYKRREDVMDPAPYLDSLVGHT